MGKLKKSKYSFFIENDEGYIIYNSLNGLIINCTEQKYIDEIKKIQSVSKIEYDDSSDFLNILYSKGVLIDDEVDESVNVRYLYNHNIINNRTLELMLVVTRQCNFRCIYCAQEHVDKVMDSSIYDNTCKLVDNMLSSKQYDNVIISFFGGEPLLEMKNIQAFLKEINKIGERYDININSSFTTNGYLLTPNNFERLTELGCVGYQITIDGMAKAHDETRALKNGYPTWEKIMNNLKYMNSTKHKFGVTLRTNYNENVLEDLQQFYKYVSQNFDDRFHIYYEPITKQGGKNDDNLEVLDLISSTTAGVEIAKLLKKYKLGNSNSSTRTIPCSTICYAAKPNFFTIDYDGSIKKCSHVLDNDLNNIGYLTDEGDMNINAYKHALWIADDFSKYESCRECKVLPLCMGNKCIASKVLHNKLNCHSDMEILKIEETIKASI